MRPAPPITVAGIIQTSLRVEQRRPGTIRTAATGLISRRRAHDVICALRGQQVAQAIVVFDRPGWRGSRQDPGFDMVITHTPCAAEPTAEAFRTNLFDLGQRVAEALGQVRVRILYGGHVVLCSAPDEPPPEVGHGGWAD